MTVVRGQEIGRELVRTLSQVNKQIDVIKELARLQGGDPYQMKDDRGAFLMTPLLAAKAQLLHAIVLVNQK